MDGNAQDGGNVQDGFDDVCRDFLRNVCRRGKSCRYRHPDTSEAEELGKKIEYIFCHDYQNRECRRQCCRFLHCTKQEEEIYRSNGKLPQHVLETMAQNKAQEKATTDPAPICKDYLKGNCIRGAVRCKFRHLSQAEYEMETRGLNNRFSNHRNNIIPNSFNERAYDAFSPPEPKRRAYETNTGFGPTSFFGAERAATMGLPGLGGAVGSEFDYPGSAASAQLSHAGAAPNALTPQAIYSNTRFLEEENTALRRRIEELKKQVADLMATNEFLLDQNAQLRTLGKPNSTASQSAASAPHPAPPPLGPPPLPPISTDLLTQTRPGEIPVVPASLGASLSASLSASLGAQGLPISSMAAIPTSLVSTSTAQLVSYPIMTATIPSLRPAIPSIPHSLSH